MRKTNKKKKKGILETMQPELIKSALQSKKLQQSLQKKQLTYEQLSKKLTKLKHEITMQQLALTMRLKSTKELQKKLADINTKSIDISKKRALYENIGNNIEAELRKKYYYDPSSQSIDNMYNQQENDND